MRFRSVFPMTTFRNSWKAMIILIVGIVLTVAATFYMKSEEEADRLMLENTRKVYMAATRAGQRLVITYVGVLPDVLRELLNIE